MPMAMLCPCPDTIQPTGGSHGRGLCGGCMCPVCVQVLLNEKDRPTQPEGREVPTCVFLVHPL
jgi:hypothetical protein